LGQAAIYNIFHHYLSDGKNMPDDSKAEIKRRIESCSNFDSISTYMVEVHKEERVKEEKISD
jgi:uncharacterized sporulation protein YeaH/YhbH (DUF444 family)